MTKNTPTGGSFLSSDVQNTPLDGFFLSFDLQQRAVARCFFYLRCSKHYRPTALFLSSPSNKEPPLGASPIFVVQNIPTDGSFLSSIPRQPRQAGLRRQPMTRAQPQAETHGAGSAGAHASRSTRQAWRESTARVRFGCKGSGDRRGGAVAACASLVAWPIGAGSDGGHAGLARVRSRRRDRGDRVPRAQAFSFWNSCRSQTATETTHRRQTVRVPKTPRRRALRRSTEP